MWEYYMLFCSYEKPSIKPEKNARIVSFNDLPEALNELGLERWELVTSLADNTTPLFIFKRPK